jgi:hypothetical protein
LNARDPAVREERRQGGYEFHQEGGGAEMANNFEGDMGCKIEERMRRLREALLDQNLEMAKWRLNVALGNMQGVEEEERVVDLTSPILKLLAQERSNKIYQTKLFCPHQGCEAEIKNVSHLMTHLRAKHHTPREACADLIGFFVRTIVPQRISYKLLKEPGEDSGSVWMSNTATTMDASAYKGTIITSKFTSGNTKRCGETSKHSGGFGARSGR